MYPHTIMFIQDLAIIMLIAAAITVVCHRLKQPVVLGYIIAGVIIGPHTPPFSFIHDETTVRTLAELGVIFLMFSLGLEFDLHKLRKVGAASFVAAFAEIIIMMWVGYELGLMFGWSFIDAIFLGAILAISSTTIIIKALEELDLKREKFAQLIFAILIIEDIFAIVILALLSGMALQGSLKVHDIIITGVKLVSFLIISLVFGIMLVPKYISYVSRFKSREMLLISILGLCFGFCLLVVKLNYSIALGAFIIGAIVAESRQYITIENLIIPLRDMFSAIFFVSVGLLLDPKMIAEYALPILIITLAVVVGKVLTCSLGVFLTGQSARTSARVGLGLAQIGEFSFIIASLGITLNITSRFLFPIAVAVSVITTFLTPYLIKYSDSISSAICKIIPRRIASFLKWYTNWVQNIKAKGIEVKMRKIIWRSVIQIIVNVFIIMGIFLVGVFVADSTWGKILIKVTNLSTEETIIWSTAFVLSLPFLIAIYRKIKALCLLLTELSVKRYSGQDTYLKIGIIVSEVLAILSIFGILLLIFRLSASILPPTKILVIVSILIILFVVLLYSWLIKLHSKLQIKFLEGMKKPNQK